jgi:vacuolar-type H+-ATPase subunit B/Vma2
VPLVVDGIRIDGFYWFVKKNFYNNTTILEVLDSTWKYLTVLGSTWKYCCGL